MLTPVEIQSKSFKSGGLGYDKKEVDAFMREVLASYEDLYRQNMEQKDKIATLNEGIQYYKTIEKTLQKALVLAEKTAEETKLTAQKEAKHIEKEARTKASIMLADARNELDSLHQQTIRLIQEYEKYKAQFKNLAAAQIELLNSDAFNINISRLDAFID
ncbi:MAG: DivIVA domain-containing protein, partial [Lachnospiraceae bacterium]|nr:DivIVA domain-containing protein [Lachnospiraceae bacterium]